MEGAQFNGSDAKRTDRSWSRCESAKHLQRAERIQCDQSQRAAAHEANVPRSTLRCWLRRKACLDMPACSAAFWESPEGVDFLHRLLVAAHLVFCNVGPSGQRQVSKFLQLTGLDRLIGASYGAQYRYSVMLREALAEFGEQEKQRLLQQMTPREITVCEDETFHPQICLVAMEPLSDFILLEQYTASRESEVWTQQLQAATAGFPVKIVQSTSDEGRSLIKHCRVGLGAHHSPDVFHVQQDVQRAFQGKVSGAVQRRKTKLREAQRETARLQAEREAAWPTHAALFEKQIELSRSQEQQAEHDVELAEQERQEVRDAIRGVSEIYHPFDLQTGEPRHAEDAKTALNNQFDDVERLADHWEVPQTGRKLLAKARKAIAKMAATIAFFWQIVRIKITALRLPEDLSLALLETLLPGKYLELASRRASKAQDRHRLRAMSQELLARARDGPLACLSDEQRTAIEQVFQDCAGLFQRSSSCVEGRNGRLALHHHGLHRLSGKKLAALTTLHNYFIERADHTTAAERFFGNRPRDLFDWLLERLPCPSRPRRRRHA